MNSLNVMKRSDFNDSGSWPGGEDSNWDQNRARFAKTGLRVLMAVITSLFFLFIVAFMIRSQISDWEHLSGPWKPLADPWRLWINTSMLILGSVCLQWARVASRRGNSKRAVEGLVLSGLFTTSFIFGQVWVWQQLVSLGYFVNSNPANSFFYLLTGLHALHLVGGMIAWVRTTVKAWSGVSVQQLNLSIELCAMYWHYLLALWLVLMALLTSSPETYAAFAAFCGF